MMLDFLKKLLLVFLLKNLFDKQQFLVFSFFFQADWLDF